MNLVVAAPLEGWAAPLSEVPDAVFAERMMGDGLAIDPVGGVLYAPFDGEIVSLPKTGHALVIRSDAGVEMLMHVGLETVALAGEGFIAHVCEGQRVRAGDRLLSFDLDFLAQRAKSLVTPIILTNGERFDIVRRTQDKRINVGDALMELRLRAGAEGNEVGEGEARREITLNFEHGLHARPAATVARTAQRFAADVTISAGGKRVNAKSPVGLMTLGARKGDALVIEAHGADAEAAAAAVAQAASAHEARAPIPPLAASTQQPALNADEIRGVTASPGLAVGVVFKLGAQQIAVREAGSGVEQERAAMARAKDAAKARIGASAQGDGRQAAIMAAHLALIDDPELSAAAARLIDAGKSAGFAWRGAIATQVDALRALGDAYMADRVADLRDLEQQVLIALGGASHNAAPALPDRAVVVAHELLPSQFAALDLARLAGLCTETGGATSHVALLAQSLGVPALAAAPGLMIIPDGMRVILDADAGFVRLSPSDTDIRRAEQAVAARRSQQAAAQKSAAGEARTADGARINVYANLGSAGETAHAVAQGAEGCGLLRTEFLFMDRETPPSEEEQRTHYQAIADALEGRPFVIRTLDAGADKPAPYMALPEETNPALGVRGLRASLRRPDLLRAQLRAMLRVEPRGRVRILLPMVNEVAEINTIRTLLAELCDAGETALGAMIETPAAAMLADQLAAEVDFFSIGTNDLAQYALAMDRGHPDLAASIDPLHPAVLRLVARTIEGARTQNRPVSVCGAAASDPLAAPLLIGLGVDTLSAAPSMIPAVKARLRRVRLDDCRKAAQHALTLTDAGEVRRYAATLWGDAT